jgi:superfamily II DNA or RNA helicase
MAANQLGSETGAVRLSEEVRLFPWQQSAVDRWIKGDRRGPHRGTLEIFTGGGKTIIALASFARVSASDPATRLAVVVPTEALARQWIEALVHSTSLQRSDVGLLGAGRRDSFVGKRALVTVLNSAAKQLPTLGASVAPLMLIVDECHRAGAATFSKVLDTKAAFRMGLSATPARDEIDENGLPLAFDQQVVGEKLGDVVFEFGLREARQAGWLPNYVVHHHGVSLTSEERLEYERISRKVSDSADRLTAAGFQASHALHLAARGGEIGSLAQAYVAAIALRKGFLYRASERARVAAQIVERARERRDDSRILIFHERVAEAAALYETLRTELPDTPMALEHSELPDATRREALAAFRSGRLTILVSVKSLVEGIDVPDADIGISVASSSSVRQRVQTLGRVLRRRFDGSVKNAEMHVIYIHDTVDELIYGKEDWSDLTGESANQYWLYSVGEVTPQRQPGPPLQPRPTEEMEWKRFGERVPEEPTLWLGALPDYELSVDTRGNVTTPEGAWIENPQGVPHMVERVRGKPGGRFRVTPVFNLVVVFGESDEGMAPYLVGKLEEPFRVRKETRDDVSAVDVSVLQAGSPYPGPTDQNGGSFKVRQKRGGVIERRAGDSIQFAVTDQEDVRAVNARGLLDAWRSLNTPGLTFFVNRLGHAWYRESGEPRFLASVREGFLWPD